MANCKKCGKPVVTAPVYCPECQEKTGGWISVKDRLPTEEDANARGNVIAVEKTEGYAKSWWWSLVDRYHQEFSVWMPFPELPREEG